MLTWQQLIRLSDDELDRLDIAAMNLACAAGLPDAETVDFGRSLRTPDEWAEKVRWETVKHFRRFEKRPEDFYNSAAYYRILTLVTVLQRDLGVRYNPEKISEEAAFDTADVFLHGITQGHGGTCASMPVVYVAVGRRLGYSLKLVKAKGEQFTHLFVRWDGEGARFNIEATAEGLSCHPDDYYRNGRYQVSPGLEKTANLLATLSPRQELANFTNERGWRWLDHGEYRKAADCFAWACAWMPGDRLQLRSLERGMQGWWENLRQRMPKRFPDLTIHFPPRRYPESLPAEIERDFIHLEILENLLNDPICGRGGIVNSCG